MKKSRMNRRDDIQHPDDLKELQENIAKADRGFERKRSSSIYAYRKDEPYIDDPVVFKAVSFARHIRVNDKKPLELAMYQAAKYYKVPLKAVAKAMGKIANYHKENT